MATKKTTNKSVKKNTTKRNTNARKRSNIKEEPLSMAPIDVFVRRMNEFSGSIFKNLLSSHNISPLQFTSIVINEVKRNRSLLEAFIVNPMSMYGAILKGAELGLIPDELTGEFWLIPRNLKQVDGTKKMTVCPQIGYKGVVNILYRNSDIRSISTEIVYKDDVEFYVQKGLNPQLTHIPNLHAEKSSQNITHVYATITYKDGYKEFEVMTRNQVENIMDISPMKSENRLYFNDSKDPMHWMVRKTVLLQLSKLAKKDYYQSKNISDVMAIEGGTYYLEDTNNSQLITIDDSKTTLPNKFKSFGKTDAAFSKED